MIKTLLYNKKNKIVLFNKLWLIITIKYDSSLPLDYNLWLSLDITYHYWIWLSSWIWLIILRYDMTIIIEYNMSIIFGITDDHWMWLQLFE